MFLRLTSFGQRLLRMIAVTGLRFLRPSVRIMRSRSLTTAATEAIAVIAVTDRAAAVITRTAAIQATDQAPAGMALIRQRPYTHRALPQLHLPTAVPREPKGVQMRPIRFHQRQTKLPCERYPDGPNSSNLSSSAYRSACSRTVCSMRRSTVMLAPLRAKLCGLIRCGSDLHKPEQLRLRPWIHLRYPALRNKRRQRRLSVSYEKQGRPHRNSESASLWCKANEFTRVAKKASLGQSHRRDSYR
jgi:hypothetical protein